MGFAAHTHFYDGGNYMKSKLRFKVNIVMILTILTFSATWTVPALADDTPPPPEETPLEQLPEGTEIVVLDEVGDVVPLATEEAAQAVLVGDPIWCPTG